MEADEGAGGALAWPPSQSDASPKLAASGELLADLNVSKHYANIH